jgi:AcrR family transcriptional regulator
MPNFTKAAIKSSFLKLLNERPLKQITVKDIVEDCGINRNSFYYHFSDIPSLIEEIVMGEANRVIDEYPSIDSVESMLNAAMEFARANKRAVMHIYNSANRAVYEQYLWQVCERIVSVYLEKLTEGRSISDSDRKTVVNFYKCVCFGLVNGWVGRGMPKEAEAEMQRICELQAGMVEEMIARCTQDAAQ